VQEIFRQLISYGAMRMENIPESNQLLAALDDTVLARLRPDLEPVDIAAREVIAEQAESPSHVYFITSGIVSRVAVTRTGRSLELACTGAEGAAGVFDVLGLPVMSHRIIAQLPIAAEWDRAVRVPPTTWCARFSKPSLQRPIPDRVSRTWVEWRRPLRVKMVHNGIEYANMQLIAEAYDLLREGLGLSVEKTYLRQKPSSS
jgi:CRP-like cAMP-binding protein